MACALMFAGWSTGFARQERAKENPAVYRFASKALAASIGGNPDLNPSLKLISEEDKKGIATHTLLESGEMVTEIRDEPSEDLMKAWLAARDAVATMDDELDLKLDVELCTVHVRGPMGNLRATCEELDILRWSSSWTWSGKGRRRSWRPAHYDAIARIAEASPCAVFPTEFPRCGVHMVQRLSTVSGEEIVFHLVSIFRTLRELDDLGTRMESIQA